MDKEEILKTAEKTFFAKRISQVNLDQIADKLDIKKPTLYYYFDNKKQLFIETLKYSKKKYIKSLKYSIKNKSLQELLVWYLVYPQQKQNLFAISLQKNYYDDLKIKNIILQGKKAIFKAIKKHLNNNHNMNDIKVYLFINLLDKLSWNNCTDDYCLDYSIENISNEIQNIFLNSK